VTLYAATVPFPALAPIVDGSRERTCESKPSHGVPPHVTLLLPIPADAGAIAEALAPFTAFDVVFAGFGRFPGALWLAPDPRDRFVRMTEALIAAFPGHLPYSGEFPEIAPHLTVAQSDLDEIESEIAPSLPLAARALSVVLFAQDDPPRWRAEAMIELAAA
jgi:2'-5' RNA ligase